MVNISRIFKLVNDKDDELDLLYRRSLDELNEFTQLNWVHSLPLMYVVQGRESVDNWQMNNVSSMNGWTYGSHQFYVLDKDSYIKEKGMRYKEGDYFKLIKHEMAHCFYQVLTNGVTKPVWLWEGFAIYLSGQNSGLNSEVKFNRFLESTETHEQGVYQEAGNVVELLLKAQGKDTLINFIKRTGYSDPGEVLKSVYGLDLTYSSFNELTKLQTT